MHYSYQCMKFEQQEGQFSVFSRFAHPIPPTGLDAKILKYSPLDESNFDMKCPLQDTFSF